LEFLTLEFSNWAANIATNTKSRKIIFWKPTFTVKQSVFFLKSPIVIKLGTAAITLPDGLINKPLLKHICAQVSVLAKDRPIILVSSGAVGSGKPFISTYKGTINQKKAAAAIGNPLLMAQYAKNFATHGITVGQCLLERSHFNHRERFVQLKATINELWKNGIIPIANDNDVVNDRELRFSDNDELATLLAVAFDAHKLLIGSSVAGLLDAQGKLVPVVGAIDENLFGLVKPEKSAQGLGGMASKLSHTRLATSMGIETVIFNARAKNGITDAMAGNTGTCFSAQKSTLNARQRWLLSGHTHGVVVVDDGAAKAVLARKSLLAVGVKEVKGQFVKGEMIEIENTDGVLIAMAKAKMQANEIGTETRSQVLAHANDMVVLIPGPSPKEKGAPLLEHD
jgi:glutamate 5-kinase